MVGFRIGNTLSESGTVSRGLCGTDANNLLTSVVERTKIQRMDGEVKYIDDNGEWTATPRDDSGQHELLGLYSRLLCLQCRGFSRAS